MTRQLISTNRQPLLRLPHAHRPPPGRLSSSPVRGNCESGESRGQAGVHRKWRVPVQVETRRPSGYELDDQTLSPVDSIALISMRPPPNLPKTPSWGEPLGWHKLLGHA